MLILKNEIHSPQRHRGHREKQMFVVNCYHTQQMNMKNMRIRIISVSSVSLW